MKSFRVCLIGVFHLVLVFAAPSAAAPFGVRPDGNLDQAAIARAYRESDWDKIIASLEGYLKKKGDSKVSPEERIFAYKHLGVIYAADSLSQTKAESYFTRLLELSPKVQIVDLYPSKRVNDLFREVRRDFEERQSYAQQFDTYGYQTQTDETPGRGAGHAGADSMPRAPSGKHSPQPIPNRNAKNERVSETGNAWVWWTVGIAAAAGAGAGAYYLTSKEPEKKIETTPIRPE